MAESSEAYEQQEDARSFATLLSGVNYEPPVTVTGAYTSKLSEQLILVSGTCPILITLNLSNAPAGKTFTIKDAGSTNITGIIQVNSVNPLANFDGAGIYSGLINTAYGSLNYVFDGGFNLWKV